MPRFFKLALGCLIFAGLAVAAAKAENPPLYVWADSLTLYAAPSFSAPAIGELPYGTAVEPLAPPGPLMPGRRYLSCDAARARQRTRHGRHRVRRFMAVPSTVIG